MDGRSLDSGLAFLVLRGAGRARSRERLHLHDGKTTSWNTLRDGCKFQREYTQGVLTGECYWVPFDCGNGTAIRNQLAHYCRIRRKCRALSNADGGGPRNKAGPKNCLRLSFGSCYAWLRHRFGRGHGRLKIGKKERSSAINGNSASR